MPRLTKKEREAQERQRREEQIRAALRWTDPTPVPDVPIPDDSMRLSTGYLFNSYTGRVNVACSSSTHHAVGQTDTTTTQGPRRLYSTRLLALQALRVAMEWECAKALAEVDEQIARER